MKTNKMIKFGQVVTAYIYGNTIEITSSNNHYVQSIVVLPQHQYLVIETGEIKVMDTKGMSRKDNLSSIKRTMRQLRRLISANFSGGKDELWVTLTYSKNINAKHQDDTKIVYRDFKSFIRKVRSKIGKIEYITVLEPQASGRWHMHVLFKTNDNSRLYVKNSVMEKLWGKGFTSTKRLSNRDNVAAYVMAYVTNLRIDNGMSKKRDIKGARIYLYPKGTKIYRRSKGIVDPKTIKATTKRKLNKVYKLTKENKRGAYEQVFVIKSKNKKIVTQTEFFEKKSINKGENSKF